MPADIVHQAGGKAFHKINQIYRPVAPARAFYIIPSFAPKKNRAIVFFQRPVGGQAQNARPPTCVSYYYHLRPSLANFRINRFPLGWGETILIACTKKSVRAFGFSSKLSSRNKQKFCFLQAVAPYRPPSLSPLRPKATFPSRELC